MVAQQHLAALDAASQQETKLKTMLKEALDDGREPQLQGFQAASLLGLRYEQFGDLVRAQQQFERIKKDYLDETDPAEDRVWYLLALQKIAALKMKLEDHKPDRLELVKKAVAEAKKDRDTPGTAIRVRSLCMNVIALYGKESDPDAEKLGPLVKDAREVWMGLPDAFKPK